MRLKKITPIRPKVILLGFISIVTQIIVLREFLTFFNGNEPVIGIILANWMMLTGIGAYLGRFISRAKKREFFIYPLLGGLSFMPLITVLLLHILWNLFFPPGMMAGIIQVFYYSLIILAPFCLITGMLFTILAKEESFRYGKNRIGNVYAWESVGSLTGGAVINLILIWVLSTFQSLYLIMVLMAAITAIFTFKAKQYFVSGVLIFMVITVSFLFLENDMDKNIRELALPGQSIIYSKDTPFGIFIITQQDGQANYYENNVLMATSGDIISKEESVHIGMIQHENPKEILVFSGVVTGIIDEITEYPVDTIDYVDINPEMIKIAEQGINPELKKKLNLIEGDPLRFLRKNNKKYDVVLLNLPKPSTIQLNRYYTKEFFQLLKKSLNHDAVVSLSVSSSANYMNDETKRLLSIIYLTLKSEFKNVLILPAGEDYILASDGQLTYKIAENVEKRNIPAEYVNTYYFDDDLLHLRSEKLMSQLNKEAPLNKNFDPVFYQSQIKLWLSHFNVQYWVPALLILLLSGFFFIKAGYIYKGVFAAGFAGTTIEIVLMLVFQVVFGYVYTVAGIFIMLFMGGLALGAYYIPKKFTKVDKKLFSRMLMRVSLFAFILPLIFLLIEKIPIQDTVLFVLFVILILIISVFTGGIFSIACKISKYDLGAVASDTYGFDLLGAATGALLFTIYIIPMMGLGLSVIATGIFMLFVSFLSMAKK